MSRVWKTGEAAALRGVIHKRVWFMQTTIVVQDTPDETVLVLLPGAQCAFPEGYIRRRSGDVSVGTRWQEADSRNWVLVPRPWQSTRFLILLTPGAYYSVFLIWDDASDTFKNYYVNFQLPYVRSHCGFDTYDLELDLVVDPAWNWRWKDRESYKQGVLDKAIEHSWAQGVRAASDAILAKVNSRQYPFDMTWRDWRPDPAWKAPNFPDRWQEL